MVSIYLHSSPRHHSHIKFIIQNSFYMVSNHGCSCICSNSIFVKKVTDFCIRISFYSHLKHLFYKWCFFCIYNNIFTSFSNSHVQIPNWSFSNPLTSFKRCCHLIFYVFCPIFIIHFRKR